MHIKVIWWLKTSVCPSLVPIKPTEKSQCFVHYQHAKLNFSLCHTTLWSYITLWLLQCLKKNCKDDTVEPNQFHSFKDYRLCRFGLEDWLISNVSINENNTLCLIMGFLPCRVCCSSSSYQRKSLQTSRIPHSKFYLNNLLSMLFWMLVFEAFHIFSALSVKVLFIL